MLVSRDCYTKIEFTTLIKNIELVERRQSDHILLWVIDVDVDIIKVNLYFSIYLMNLKKLCGFVLRY